MKNSNCVIITQKEWLNWLAFGYLRISPSRISYFDNTESSFEILMSYSVDNALDEEDAYLIASLVNDYSREELHVKRTSLSDYILVQAVQGFYTLSAKGADLLEYEAGQSHSILHYDSKIENLWNEWKNTQFRLRSHEKGNKFLEILGYSRFEVEPEVDDGTLFSQTLKNYTRNRLIEDLKDLSNNNSFAWFFTNYQFSKTDKNIYGNYKKLRKSSENIEFKNLSNTYITQNLKYLAKENGYLINHHSFIAEKIFFDRISESKGYLLATSFLVHYYNLLDNDYEINLQFLKTDLAFLGEVYPRNNIPQLIAYFIGKRLNEVYLSHLYIAKNIDKEKPGMFDPNFFSNLKNKKLMLCNIDQGQLQEIISKVNLIAEEIQRAYNIELNNVQDSELVSYPIEEKDGNSNQVIQSQSPMTDNGNIETKNILPNTKTGVSNNTNHNNSTQPHSETQKSVDSQDSVDNTKDMDKPDEIECDAKLSNISTTTNNENETIRCDQVQEDKKSINTSPIGQGSLLDMMTEEEFTPINPIELLDDAISIIKELPKGKENHGGFFKDLLFSKNVRYKDKFKDLKNLSEFFEAFAKIVGNDMKKHTKFVDFKKELLLNR